MAALHGFHGAIRGAPGEWAGGSIKKPVGMGGEKEESARERELFDKESALLSPPNKSTNQQLSIPLHEGLQDYIAHFFAYSPSAA